MDEFVRMCPAPEAFVDSTAAARVNAYLDGGSGCPGLEADLPLLGLSDEGQEYLKGLCRSSR